MPRRAFTGSALAHAAIAVFLFTVAGPPAVNRTGVQAISVYVPARPVRRIRPLRGPRRVFRLPEPQAYRSKLVAVEKFIEPAPFRAIVPEEAPPSPMPVPEIRPPEPVPANAVAAPAGFKLSSAPAPMPRHTGSFDAPASAPVRDVRVISEPGGFASIAAAATPRTAAGSVRAGAFANPEPPRPPASPVPRVTAAEFGSMEARTGPSPKPPPHESGATPLEIVDKPRPEYSREARRLKLEGSVLLEACFSALGQVRVLRILRGLGHGLDENAAQAAAGIRFRPAMDHGRPVDTVASVRIDFQLAY
jgi:TonB family protein